MGSRYRTEAQLEVDVTPRGTEEELFEVCGRIGDGKALSFNSIPNKALKLAVGTRPDCFINTFEASMAEGVFPPQWKKQKLVL